MNKEKLMEEMLNQMSEGEAKVIVDFILDEAENDLLDISDIEQYLITKGRIIKSLLRAYQMGAINERDRIMNRCNEYGSNSD